MEFIPIQMSPEIFIIETIMVIISGVCALLGVTYILMLNGNMKTLRMWRSIFKFLKLENYFNKKMIKWYKSMASGFKRMGEHYEEILNGEFENNK